MTPKNKNLPEDFAEQLKTKTVEELIAIFDTTELTAISAANKKCALAYPECPDGLTRWLVAQGLDVDLRSGGGWSPLVLRVRHPEANIRILLELGANPNGVYGGGLPLKRAVLGRCLEHVKTLVEHGADPFKPDGVGPNALESAVHDCDRRGIAQALPIVEYLVQATRVGRGTHPDQRPTGGSVLTSLLGGLAGSSPQAPLGGGLSGVLGGVLGAVLGDSNQRASAGGGLSGVLGGLLGGGTQQSAAEANRAAPANPPAARVVAGGSVFLEDIGGRLIDESSLA